MKIEENTDAEEAQKTRDSHFLSVLRQYVE